MTEQPAAANMVIEMLADAEAELLEHNASLEADVQSYRVLVQVALQQLHEYYVEADRARARIHNLIGELRRARDEVRALGAQLRAQQEHAA